MVYHITTRGEWKILESEGYNYRFNRSNGIFFRWGRTHEEDPQFSPFGPELADIEISTSCSQGCPWCYKNNVPAGKNMSLDTFKVVFQKLPNTLTQIAFGIGDIDANPDLWSIFRHCRANHVIPNVTINGSHLTPEHARKFVDLCGSVAVSHYDDDTCFDAVHLLANAGGTQVNIHQLMSRESAAECLALVEKATKDPRLVNHVNAIMFLSLKRKGRGTGFNPIENEKFKKIIEAAFRRKITFGFDSCSANRFFEVIKEHPDHERLAMVVEACEGSCFSVYINVDGVAYPCSFMEGQVTIKGISTLGAKDFLQDVWFSREFTEFREKLMLAGRSCPEFKEGGIL